MSYQYWVIHGGTSSMFAAYSAKEASEIVAEWNKIAVQYDLPPTNRALVVSDGEKERFEMELARREKEGDLNYFEP